MIYLIVIIIIILLVISYTLYKTKEYIYDLENKINQYDGIISIVVDIRDRVNNIDKKI